MAFDVEFEEITNEFNAEFESSNNEFGVEFESTVEVAGGLTEDVKQALLELFQHLAYTDADGQEYYDALYDAFYPPRELANIVAVYTQTGTVYPDTPLDDLKTDLVVTARYSDGTTEEVTDYTLSGTLTAGRSTVTVSYGGKSTTFSVTVSAPATLESISAVYTQSGTVYPTDSLDSLKPDLVVTAHYSDSSTATVTTYTLSGSLTVGTSTITVTYSGKTTTFNVTVTAVPVLDSITAVYTQSGTVYDTDSLDSLKADLVVTAVYTDSSTEVVPSTDYTLSGTLTAGTSTITVSYEGKTAIFSVTVTAYWTLMWDYSQGAPIGKGFEHSTAVTGAMVSEGYQIQGTTSGGCNIILSENGSATKGVTEFTVKFTAIRPAFIGFHFDVIKYYAVSINGYSGNYTVYYNYESGNPGNNAHTHSVPGLVLSLNTDYTFKVIWDSAVGASVYMNGDLLYQFSGAFNANRTRWFMAVDNNETIAIIKSLKVRIEA